MADERMRRRELLERLARRIDAIRCDHPIRVGIDGCDAAGKTTLADELVEPLAALGRSAIRASIDGFHNPSVVRYQRGRDSADGYFRDSFDNRAIVANLLEPLGPRGSNRYRRSVFDFRADRELVTRVEIACVDAVLLFDGVFLHRYELSPFWDFSVFLDVDFDTAVARALKRDEKAFGSAESVRTRCLRRYVPGQQLYFAMCNPSRQATVVIDNTDATNPRITMDGGARTRSAT